MPIELTGAPCKLVTGILSLFLLMVFLFAKGEEKRRNLFFLIALIGMGNTFFWINHLFYQDPSNFSHYFLGTKYSIPYDRFYYLVAMAKRVFPLFGDERKTRLFAKNLLAKYGIAVPNPLIETEDLRRLCQENGVFTKEFQELARRFISQENLIRSLEQDCLAAPVCLEDAGFNASPFLIFLRGFDPCFQVLSFKWGYFAHFIFQILVFFPSIFLLQKSFFWSGEEACFCAALFFANWDFSGWLLSGLVFSEWFFPICLCFFCFSRGKPLLAGASIAFAGAVKLFPFILVLPGFLAIPALLRGKQKFENFRLPKFFLSLLLCSCAFFLVSLLGSVSWISFFKKIIQQFYISGSAFNSVSITKLVNEGFALGEHQIWMGNLIMIGTLSGILIWRILREGEKSLAECGLLVLCFMPWISRDWLNYYAVLALIAVPLVARNGKEKTGLILVIFTLSGFMPDFEETPGKEAFVRFIHCLGYWLVPVFFVDSVFAEGRPATDAQMRGNNFNAILLGGIGLLTLVLGGFGLQSMTIRDLEIAFINAQEEKDVPKAEKLISELRERRSMNPELLFQMGLLLQENQKPEMAKEYFREILTTNRDHFLARHQMGIISFGEKDYEGAMKQFSQASELVPHLEIMQFDLALASWKIAAPGSFLDHLFLAFFLAPSKTGALLDSLGTFILTDLFSKAPISNEAAGDHPGQTPEK